MCASVCEREQEREVEVGLWSPIWHTVRISIWSDRKSMWKFRHLCSRPGCSWSIITSPLTFRDQENLHRHWHVCIHARIIWIGRQTHSSLHIYTHTHTHTINEFLQKLPLRYASCFKSPSMRTTLTRWPNYSIKCIIIMQEWNKKGHFLPQNMKHSLDEWPFWKKSLLLVVNNHGWQNFAVQYFSIFQLIVLFCFSL